MIPTKRKGPLAAAASDFESIDQTGHISPLEHNATLQWD
jgi:hypothetical protein